MELEAWYLYAVDTTVAASEQTFDTSMIEQARSCVEGGERVLLAGRTLESVRCFGMTSLDPRASFRRVLIYVR